MFIVTNTVACALYPLRTVYVEYCVMQHFLSTIKTIHIHV